MYVRISALKQRWDTLTTKRLEREKKLPFHFFDTTDCECITEITSCLSVIQLNAIVFIVLRKRKEQINVHTLTNA